LLSDVVMPEMSGVELAKALKANHPESRIILTSARQSEIVDVRALPV
jgi:YesN/AraC family two-component response regulator